MQIVDVTANMLKPFRSVSRPFVRRGCHRGTVLSGFFVFCHPTVLHTIVRLNPEGVEEKGTRYA